MGKINECDISVSNTTNLKLKGFNVYQIETEVSRPPVYTRRDFYKVCIIHNNCIIHYADKSIELSGHNLFFANPYVPYSVELLSPNQLGYA